MFLFRKKPLPTVLWVSKFWVLPEVTTKNRARNWVGCQGKRRFHEITASGFSPEVCCERKMAAVQEASREAAFEAFRAEFTRNG